MDFLKDLIPESLLFGLTVGSAIAFGVSLLLVPLIMVRLPSNYLNAPPQKSGWWNNPMVRIVRNVLGVALVVLGILLLVLPGQGIFSIVLGVSLTDFKRKREVQRKLIGSGKALRFINKLRKRFGQKPLEPPKRS
jgi:Putative transmembrane protein (PGPGW)